MTWVIELPDLSAWPAWAWWIVAAVVWYAAAGLAVRVFMPAAAYTDWEAVDFHMSRACLTIFSPLVAAIGVAWLAVSLATFGAVAWPWVAFSTRRKP